MSAVLAAILLTGSLGILLLAIFQRRGETRLATEVFDSRLEGFKREILEFRGVEKQVRELGLASAERSICDFDYAETFRDCRQLTILMHDGASWLGENLHWIKLGAEKELRIQAILVHPESDFVPILAYRQQIDPTQLREKIEGSARLLQDELGDRVEVWGHILPTSYSVVMSETTGVFMPYPASRERSRVPAFVFTEDRSDDSFLMQLRRDVEALRIDCRPIFEPPYPEEVAGGNGSPPLAVVPADFEWKRGNS